MKGASMPDARIAPTAEPADVPMMWSAEDARQPVSDSSASRAPIIHESPTTPPAPRTRPTFIGRPYPGGRCDERPGAPERDTMSQLVGRGHETLIPPGGVDCSHGDARLHGDEGPAPGAA